METKVEALEGDRSKVTVTVDAQDVDSRIKQAYRDVANKYNFPGFRKGRAPRPIVDNALGKEAIRATATDEMVNTTYPLAIDQSGLYPISKPDFDETGLVEDGKPYTFAFTVTNKPTFDLSAYDPVEIKLPPKGASDHDIDEQINELREHYFTLEDVDDSTKIEENGSLELGLVVTDEKGEEIASLSADARPYTLGIGLFPSAFDEHLIGLKKGDDTTFTLEVTDTSPLILASFAGSTLTFKASVHAVKKRVLPEVVDAWAKDTLGFESVEDLRGRIAESVAQNKETMMPRIKEQACLEAIAKRLDAEIPAGMIEDAEAGLAKEFFQQLQAQGMSFDVYLMQKGMTPDQFKADLERQAADTTRQDLALDAWARHKNLSVSDEEIAAEFDKSGVKNPRQMQAQWTASGQLHMIRQGILRTKAVMELMETAHVSELDTASSEAPAQNTSKKKTASKAATSKEKKTGPAKGKTSGATSCEGEAAKSTQDAGSALRDGGASSKKSKAASSASARTPKTSTLGQADKKATSDAEEKKPAKKPAAKKSSPKASEDK